MNPNTPTGRGRKRNQATTNLETPRNVNQPLTHEDDPHGIDSQADPNELILDDEINDEESANELTPEDIMKLGDLPGEPISEVDKMMYEIYGDKVYQNNGTHLDGGIQDDEAWQTRYTQLANLPQFHYDPPKGTVGKRLAKMCTKELKSIRERHSNSKRLLTMLTCLLTRDRNIKGAPAIKKKINTRMDEWDIANHETLISDTLRLLTNN